MSKKSYLDWTYNAKNPIRRYAHRTRFRRSIESVQLSNGSQVLDFGCGNGLFLNQLASINNLENIGLIGFEPFLESVSDNNILIYKEWESIELHIQQNKPFDFVTAFEVFEHFSPSNQTKALQKIKSVLSPNGRLILSVPIEIGAPALLKTAIRRVNHPHHKALYNLKNAMSSFRGQPLPTHRADDGYLSHVGFYFRDLELLMKEEGWVLSEKSFSPFKRLNHNFNSQVFYSYSLE